MKFRVTLKDPDAVYEALNDFLENETFGLTDEDEIESLRESRHEKYTEIASEWFRYGEYLTVEIDTDIKEIRVLKVSELE